MFAGDHQLVIAVVQQASAEEPLIRTKIAAAKAGFDRDFLQARRAEHQLVPSIVNHTAGGDRQALRLPSRPEQQLRILQQFHEARPKSSSISGLPIRSKSSGTAISPAINPSRRTSPASGVSSGTTFTIGLPRS